jgi:hypothetical protein
MNETDEYLTRFTVTWVLHYLTENSDGLTEWKLFDLLPKFGGRYIQPEQIQLVLKSLEAIKKVVRANGSWKLANGPAS